MTGTDESPEDGLYYMQIKSYKLCLRPQDIMLKKTPKKHMAHAATRTPLRLTERIYHL